MDKGREFRFVANKVYTIPGKGLVVTGRVEKGSVSVGDEIGFIGLDGQMAGAGVAAIEVSRRLVEAAQAGQEASLLLEGVRKGQIVQGTVLMELPEAPPGPVAPGPAEPVGYKTAEPPPSPYSPTPISPSSGWGRSIMYILVGLLFLLAMLFFQGKLDTKKGNPRRWDPGKKRTSVQLSVDSHPLFYFFLSSLPKD
ncbi:MAG: hypothetical protein ACM3N7_03280 [Planctomycetaceae bacterium]